MVLSHLLDTSVFCQPIKDDPIAAVMERWSDLGEAAVCTSAICLAEVLQGLEQRQSEKYWRRYHRLLKGRYSILPVDETIGAQFAKLSSELRRAGQPRPALDLFIAATARRHGLTIVTLTIKHFIGIPGLTVEDWSG